MKRNFEEPTIEVICYSVEDVITVSGVRGGGIFGFDEVEPNKNGYVQDIPSLVPPCAGLM